jgi:hypothetical protein
VKAFLSKHGLFQTKKSRQPGCLSTLYALDPLLCVLSFRVVCLYQLLEIFILFSNFPFLLIIFPKKRNFRHQFLNILYFLYFSSVIPSKPVLDLIGERESILVGAYCLPVRVRTQTGNTPLLMDSASSAE